MPLPFVKQQDTFAQQTVLQKNVKLMENSRHPVLVKSRMLLLSPIGGTIKADYGTAQTQEPTYW